MGAIQPVTVSVRVIAPWSGSEQNSRQAPALTASVREPPPFSPTVSLMRSTKSPPGPSIQRLCGR